MSRPPPLRNQLASRPAWKDWPELTIQLRRLPPQTRTLDIWKTLHKKGEIAFIDVVHGNSGEPTGIVRVRFSPVPAHSFWDSGSITIAVFGQNRQVDARLMGRLPIRMVRSPVRYNVQYAEVTDMRATSLDFGFLSQETIVDIMRTIPGNVSLTIDLKGKKVVLKFPCSIEDPKGTGKIAASEYKTHIYFNHLKKVFRVNVDSNNWAMVINLGSPPAFFRRRKNIEESHDVHSSRWGDNETWQRIDEIAYESSRHQKVSLKSSGFIQIGKWTTYVLRFHRSEDENWRMACDMLRDYNIQVFVTTSESFKWQIGTPSKFWNMVDAPAVATANDHLALLHDADSVHFPFELRYQLEAAISQGVFTEQSITPAFLKKLGDLNDERGRYVNKAKNILECFTDAGKRVYEPMSIFENKEALQYYPAIGLPEHCTWVRKVIVTPSSIYLGSPSVETTNRVLRQYANNTDRFIRVQFLDERIEGRISAVPDSTRSDPLFRRVFRTLMNGIQIGDRHFQFLAFGNSQFRENGAYFFCPTESQSCDNIRDWMGDFRHIKIVAKYAARLGQCFSTTRTPKGIAVGTSTKHIPEIEKGGFCFSDGVGKISGYLASQIAFKLDMHKNNHCPSAFQFRLGGHKGLLVNWPEATFNEIHLRPSQKKFDASAKNIEIIKPSRFAAATLNRQIVNILSCLGVPDEVFIELTQSQLADYKLAMTDPETALRLLNRFVDVNGMTTTIAQMINDGFMVSSEPFTNAILQLWRAWSMKFLREKAKIVVEQGAHVFGCVDETNTLKGHSRDCENDAAKDRSKLPQIFLQIPELDTPCSYRIIKGPCVVGRNPSLHPGDIRVVEAVDVPALRHLRDLVVFPASGDQDIPSMCSGGDLDGDEFFVFFEPKLIPDEWNHSPMTHVAVYHLYREVTIKDVMKFFVEYMKNDSLGAIANAHLVTSDRKTDGPKDPECLKLAELHSNAVDYVKTGKSAHIPSRLRPKKFPHFMGRDEKRTYKSLSVLGQLYDLVTSVDFTPKYDGSFDKRILNRYQLSDKILGKARDIKSQYDVAMRRIMNQREIKTEFEVFSTFVLSKPRVGTDYKVQEDMGFVMTALRDRFVPACKAAADDDKLDEFIAAMYRITWEEVQIALQQSKQTRLVAGFVISRRTDMPLISFPWLFDAELGRIAMSSKEENMQLDEVPVLLIGEANAVETEDGNILHRGQELFVVPAEVGEGEYEGDDEDSKHAFKDHSSLDRDDLKTESVAETKASNVAEETFVPEIEQVHLSEDEDEGDDSFDARFGL